MAAVRVCRNVLCTFELINCAVVDVHDNGRLGGRQHGLDLWLRDSLGHLLLRLGFLVFGLFGGKLVLGLLAHGRGSFLLACEFLLNGL